MKTRHATAQKGLDSDLIKSSAHGDAHRVKLLLDSGADIHAQDDQTFRLSAGYGYQEVAKLLLDRGADIHAQDDQAFRWAAKNGHLEVVNILLAHGADLEIGIKAAKDVGKSRMLGILNQIKLSREEKKLLSMEIQEPEPLAVKIRM